MTDSNEFQIEKLDKKERNKNILYLAICFLLFAEFFIAYLLPDDRFLDFTRTMGFIFIGFMGFFAGMVLVQILSGRKQKTDLSQKMKETQAGLLMILLIVWVILAFKFDLFYFLTDNPKDYMWPLLINTGLLFIVGVLGRVIYLYPDKLHLPKRKINN